MKQKHTIKKVTYRQLEVFVMYLSMARYFEDPDEALQAMSRKLLIDLYVRLARRHLHADPDALFTISFSRLEAQAVCKYVGWLGATGEGHADQLVNDYYRQLHQFTA